MAADIDFLAGHGVEQLCSHAARMTSRAQWNDLHGRIEFPGVAGIGRIIAEADRLHLAPEAIEPADLVRWQKAVGDDIRASWMTPALRAR